MISAFGVEHTEQISKADAWRSGEDYAGQAPTRVYSVHTLDDKGRGKFSHYHYDNPYGGGPVRLSTGHSDRGKTTVKLTHVKTGESRDYTDDDAQEILYRFSTAKKVIAHPAPVKTVARSTAPRPVKPAVKKATKPRKPRKPRTTVTKGITENNTITEGKAQLARRKAKIIAPRITKK